MATAGLTGKKFGRLLVIGRSPTTFTASGQRRYNYLCLCDCGKEVSVFGGNMTHGNTRSCGCQRVANGHMKKVHGASHTPTHNTFVGMIRRCQDPTHLSYPTYGAKGITVCERWLFFENFLADMGERPEGKTLDRYPDHNGNYEPGNCRWATDEEQANNRRDVKTYSCGNASLSAAQWSRLLDLPYRTLLRNLTKNPQYLESVGISNG